ncbi:MAG TPA: hypothetical protein VN616_17370 [Puia sp.]|nr:hypothetical protein [Puia sp.]
MKQLLFLLIFSTAAAFSVTAQSGDSASNPGSAAGAATMVKRPVSPAQRAARQLTMLQKKLNLNHDQVIKLRMILLHLNVSLDSLRSNPSGDKKADNKARRAVMQDADVQTYALLTTDQQAAYTQWKQEMQTKRRLHRAARQGAGAGPGSPQDQ